MCYAGIGAQFWSVRLICSWDLVHSRDNVWGSNSHWRFVSAQREIRVVSHVSSVRVTLFHYCFILFLLPASCVFILFLAVSSFLCSFTIFSFSLHCSIYFLYHETTCYRDHRSTFSIPIWYVFSASEEETSWTPPSLVLSRFHHSSPSVCLWTRKTHISTSFKMLVSMRIQLFPFHPRTRDSLYPAVSDTWSISLHNYLLCMWL